MRITRLYHPEDLSCGSVIRLDKDSSNHLIRVLRTRPNSPLILFNGDGYDYLCKTLDENPKQATVSIESRQLLNNESSLNITLLQGLSRQHRMETTIQKSVELGVSRIIPVICQRSNLKLNKVQQAKKLQHWQKVIISACEQSGRSKIPHLSELITIDQIKDLSDSASTRIVLNPLAQQSLKELDTEGDSFDVFIGPEGGLSDSELALLNSCGFRDISFGPRIMRTETAGPAVISALQVLWGDF